MTCSIQRDSWKKNHENAFFVKKTAARPGKEQDEVKDENEEKYEKKVGQESMEGSRIMQGESPKRFPSFGQATLPTGT